jgi:hypothetical protein
MFLSANSDFDVLLRSAADIPIFREKALHHFALYVVREAPTRPDKAARDVLIGPPLTRLHDCVVDAPYDAGFVHKSRGMVAAKAREICCVCHG